MSDLDTSNPDYDYPTEHSLRKIRRWDFADGYSPLMDYVKSLWWPSGWGWHQQGRHYRISTGGWSGNEDVMYALGRNFQFWSQCWKVHRAGGHYAFEIPKGVVKPNPDWQKGGKKRLEYEARQREGEQTSGPCAVEVSE